ncbi:unnamed protein product [Brassica napus]|uniref:(rape) hypothetical protein n=1 Tax=Brassica napus TaxID=3708 RepID=A0A816YQZ1_BRANA|nr:unnamed protein product [Brassica napus]
MDENVPYLPTEKVDQLQSSDTRERKVRDDVAEVCGDIEFAVYKCLQEEWGVLEKSPEAALDVDQTIFVVTGGRRGEEQNDGVMGSKKLLQQEDLLALRPSSCLACLLQ